MDQEVIIPLPASVFFQDFTSLNESMGRFFLCPKSFQIVEGCWLREEKRAMLQSPAYYLGPKVDLKYRAAILSEIPFILSRFYDN